MEQLGSHWKDFHEIQYLIIFLKSVEEIQFSLKYDENNEYFTCRPITFMIICRLILLRITNVSRVSCRENPKTHIVLHNVFLKAFR